MLVEHYASISLPLNGKSNCLPKPALSSSVPMRNGAPPTTEPCGKGTWNCPPLVSNNPWSEINPRRSPFSHFVKILPESRAMGAIVQTSFVGFGRADLSRITRSSGYYQFSVKEILLREASHVLTIFSCGLHSFAGFCYPKHTPVARQARFSLLSPESRFLEVIRDWGERTSRGRYRSLCDVK